MSAEDGANGWTRLLTWWRRGEPLAELGSGGRRRVRVAGLVAAGAAITLLALFGAAARQGLFDRYQRWLPSPTFSRDVVVVMIDDASLRAVGAWPWSRYTLARLTEEIAQRGPRSIAFDMVFSEPDRQTPATFLSIYPELDRESAAAVRALLPMDEVFSRVIGRAPVVLSRIGVGEREAEPLPPVATFAGPLPDALMVFPHGLGNLPQLDGAAAGLGFGNAYASADGVIRAAPLVARIGGVATPSLSLEAVRVAEGVDEVRLEGTRRGLTAVHVGRRRVPVDAAGRLWPRMADIPQRQVVSAANVLRRGFPEDAFRDRIVLVGLAAVGEGAVKSTPRDAAVYGLFVEAQLIDAILAGRGLARPAWAPGVEWALGVAMLLLSWLGLPRAPLRTSALLALAEAGVAIGGSVAAFQHGWLVDPLPMLAPGAAASAAMVVTLFVEGRRLETRLRGDLETERLEAARTAGEMAAASQIQAGMLIPRQALARITARAEIDAVLLPARSVGGDLYDAFLIDEDRLCFLIGDVSGKGTPASLFMALAKAHACSLLKRPGVGLAEAITGVNAELSRDNGQSLFVTLLAGVLDLRDGTLELCRAGHDDPIVVGVDGVARDLRQAGGPPLCAMDDWAYDADRHTLAVGETLVAFTDGLTEAASPAQQLFGATRTRAAIERAAAESALPAVVDAIVEQVRAFEAGGDPTDDLAVLALRRVSE